MRRENRRERSSGACSAEGPSKRRRCGRTWCNGRSGRSGGNARQYCGERCEVRSAALVGANKGPQSEAAGRTADHSADADFGFGLASGATTTSPPASALALPSLVVPPAAKASPPVAAAVGSAPAAAVGTPAPAPLAAAAACDSCSSSLPHRAVSCHQPLSARVFSCGGVLSFSRASIATTSELTCFGVRATPASFCARVSLRRCRWRALAARILRSSCSPCSASPRRFASGQCRAFARIVGTSVPPVGGAQRSGAHSA